jgi:WD40 repeat protein
MSDTASLTAVARQWTLDTSILGLAHNRRGDWAALALANGGIAVLAADDAGEDPKIISAHEGVSLSLTPDADDHAFLSGGDDGRVVIIDPAIATATEIAAHKGQWIDHVAAEASGQRAYASGKKLYKLNVDGALLGQAAVLPSSIGGLTYSPNGKRLAVSHYNGVSLFWAQAQDSEPELLPWKGSHLHGLFSPDGKILLTALQDNALHGWKLGANLKLPEAGNEMQMHGYENKVHSMGFTAKGKFLATSGASQIVCWPFTGGGPWGKAPMMLGGADGTLVTRVAPHPRDEMVAAGFDDGRIIFAPLDGRMEVLVHPPIAPQGAGITGLGWNADGDTLIATAENGWIGLFTLASVTRFVRGSFGR